MDQSVIIEALISQADAVTPDYIFLDAVVVCLYFTLLIHCFYMLIKKHFQRTCNDRECG